MHITWVLLVQEVERHTTSVNPAVGVWSDAAKLVPKLAVLTVAANVGTRTLGFTYDSPIVSDSSFNQPTSAGGTVTIKGLNSYGLCSYGLCGYGLCSYGL